MPDHYEDQIDPNLMAMLTGQGGNMFGLAPEYSASRGAFMPTDIGSLSTGYNVMQDQLQLLQNPLVLMMLGMTDGPQFGMVPADDGVDDGRVFLENIISQYGAGGMSPEAHIAERILGGQTPKQAVDSLKKYGEEKVVFDDGEERKRSVAMFGDGNFDEGAWLEIANDYSNRLMSDRAPTMKPGAGMQAALDMGIDPSAEYSGVDLNPDLQSAADEYDRVRSEYDQFERPVSGGAGASVGRGLGGLLRESQGLGPRKAMTPKVVRDVVPRLGAARRALQSESGVAAARQQFARESGASPMRDELRAMLNFIGGEARGL